MKNLKRTANSNIDFLGQLTDEDLLSYYQNCQAVIFPTEEDFGLVPVEAMACGKLIITTNVGGIEDFVENNQNGFLIDDFAEDKFVDIISDIMNNKVDINSIIKKANEMAIKKFNFNRLRKDIEYLYSSLRK